MNLNRRQFLRTTAIGAGALVMPLSMNETMAAASELGPRRFIFIRKPVGFKGLVEVAKTLKKYWFEMVELPRKGNGHG